MRLISPSLSIAIIFSGVLASCSDAAAPGDEAENWQSTSSQPLEPTSTGGGVAETSHRSGVIDRTNPFFLELGVNGRTCETCHDASTGWTITPAFAQSLFDSTDGLAALFRPVDETVRPDADVSTVETRRSAYALLLSKGLTRFTRTIPATAEYEVASVDDPYGWSTPTAFSNFRRIPSVANDSLLSSVQWTTGPHVVRDRIAVMMNAGTKFHAERTTDVPADQAAAGADFVMNLFFAQTYSYPAGNLDEAGAMGGPDNLMAQPFYLGINALTGDAQTGAPFNREAFTLYRPWLKLQWNWWSSRDRARASIARGERLFNTREFDITGVSGLNDDLGEVTIRGTCTTCHNTPNVGGHSTLRMMNTGVADASRRTSDIPLVTVRNKVTGETKSTTDLGRALVTSAWADIGKFKVSPLRGVRARAPYFHDGSAASLRDVVEFYEERFDVHLSGSERDDLIAFLKAL